MGCSRSEHPDFLQRPPDKASCLPYDSFMDSKTNSDTTLAMVRVREARRAFREFHADCFWYCRKDLVIGPGDVDWVAETLRKNGDMRAWRVAGRLSP